MNPEDYDRKATQPIMPTPKVWHIVTKGGYVAHIFRCAAGWCWRIERAGEQVESGEGLDDGDAAVASAENALRRLLSRL